MSDLKTLIIYEENPEKLSFYVVPHDAAMLPHIRKIHNKMVNGDELTEEQSKIADRLSGWLVSKNGEAAKVETKNGPITGHKIVEVIHTGFIL